MNSKEVSITAITAALYIVLGYMFQPISFLGLQFRVAEIMVGMVIIYPRAGIVGNVIGVFFVNLTSPLGLIDLLSCLVNIPALLLIVVFRKSIYKYMSGGLYSLIIALYVATLLNFSFGLPLGLMFVQVFVAETILSTIGIVLFSRIGKFIKE